MVWTYFRLSTQQKDVETTLSAVQRYDADFKEFTLWLTKVELVLKRHDEKSASGTAGDDQQNIERAFQVGTDDNQPK